MDGKGTFSRWSVAAADLVGLTPEKARDIVVKCFIEAQRETFLHATQRLGSSADPESIRRNMTASVRMTFKEAGYDFDHPTPEALGAVVQRLGRAAMAWGTPEEVIRHHQGQIEKVLKKLSESRAHL